MLYISANNEHIPSKLIPAMQGNMVNAQKSNYLEMSRSRLITSKTIKITFWPIIFEPKVVETSGWLENIPYRMALLKATSELTYDVTFWRYVTSNKIYDFFTFLKSLILNRFFWKCIHILLGPILCTLQKTIIDQKNITYVSMATKTPIIKHREFFHIQCCISPLIMNISLQKLHQPCREYGERTKIKWPFEAYHFVTGSRRDFWLVAKYSLMKYIWCMLSSLWRTTYPFASRDFKSRLQFFFKASRE